MAVFRAERSKGCAFMSMTKNFKHTEASKDTSLSALSPDLYIYRSGDNVYYFRYNT